MTTRGLLKPMIARVGRFVFTPFLFLGDLGALAVSFFKINQTIRHQLAPFEPAE
jgi:hypothetical protein